MHAWIRTAFGGAEKMSPDLSMRWMSREMGAGVVVIDVEGDGSVAVVACGMGILDGEGPEVDGMD